MIVENLNGLIFETNDTNRIKYENGWCSECSSSSNDEESKEKEKSSWMTI